MTFIYELDSYRLTMYPQTKEEVKTFATYRNTYTDRQTYRQTPPKLFPRHFAGVNKKSHFNTDTCMSWHVVLVTNVCTVKGFFNADILRRDRLRYLKHKTT